MCISRTSLENWSISQGWDVAYRPLLPTCPTKFIRNTVELRNASKNKSSLDITFYLKPNPDTSFLHLAAKTLRISFSPTFSSLVLFFWKEKINFLSTSLLSLHQEVKNPVKSLPESEKKILGFCVAFSNGSGLSKLDVSVYDLFGGWNRKRFNLESLHYETIFNERNGGGEYCLG